MDNLLRHLKWTMYLCYLDDIIVFSEIFYDLLQRLRSVLKCIYIYIEDAGLILNPKKCVFGSRQIKILGHLVSEEGLKDPSGRLARWALRLQECNVEIVYKSGKKNEDADSLSRNPVEDEVFTSEQKTINFDPNGRKWLTIIPKHLRLEILQDFHDASTAGHPGFAKTYNRIRKRFFWPGLYRSVRRYVMHCREYQRRKSIPQKPPGVLIPIPPASAPFQRVGIDLLGRFSGSTKGNKWIIVCVDYLSRFTVTKALPTAEAEEVTKFITEEIVIKHETPRTILTDRGKVFESKLVTELGQLCSSKHRKTNGYHPQTNGLTERLNKTLEDMLLMYVDVEQTNWDEILPLSLLLTLLRNKKQRVTLLFNFSMVEKPKPHLTLCFHTSLTDQKMTIYDARHRRVSYRPGELVWVFTPVRNVGLSEKLLKRYFCPYRVVRKLSDVTYEIEQLEPSPRRLKSTQVVHAQRMKKYYTPEAQERILTNDIEKLPTNAPAGAKSDVRTDKKDTTLDSPGEIVPYRGPMTISRTRNVKEQ
ncbi:transposon Tf2-11 polyprotein [Trichonephila clavipes]|nr:transposon Tf2-11 polyprotein [Trichonephila clavipes]